MSNTWNDQQPIYRQLRDRVVGQIIAGHFAELEAVPSVRQVSSQEKINHLTVAKAYQELVDQGVLEMKRGRGMFVKPGAKQLLLAQEKQQFIDQELPSLHQRLQRLGISVSELADLLQGCQGHD